MDVGDRAVLEYQLANFVPAHYLPGKIIEITKGKRIATIKLDETPSFLATDILRVETKHLFARWRPL